MARLSLFGLTQRNGKLTCGLAEHYRRKFPGSHITTQPGADDWGMAFRDISDEIPLGKEIGLVHVGLLMGGVVLHIAQRGPMRNYQRDTVQEFGRAVYLVTPGINREAVQQRIDDVTAGIVPDKPANGIIGATYCEFSNNCEHLTTYLLTGRANSMQARVGDVSTIVAEKHPLAFIVGVLLARRINEIIKDQ